MEEVLTIERLGSKGALITTFGPLKVADARKAVLKNVFGAVVGLEKDPQMAETARENMEQAGLAGLVRIETGDFFTWDGLPERAETLVLNPPYGERLAVDNIAGLYQRMGDRFKQAYGGWTAFVLSGNLEAVKYIGLRSSQRSIFYNGAIECRLVKHVL